MPGKSQVPTVGILPNNRSQLGRLLFGNGNRLVYGPATVELSNGLNILYRFWPSPPFM